MESLILDSFRLNYVSTLSYHCVCIIRVIVEIEILISG